MTNKEAAKASHGRLFTTKQEHPSPQRRQRGRTAELILLSLAAYSTRHTRHASTDARIKQPTSGPFCPVTVRSVNYCPQRHFHLTTAPSEFDPFSPAESVKSHSYITFPLQHSSHTMRCVNLDCFTCYFILTSENSWLRHGLYRPLSVLPVVHCVLLWRYLLVSVFGSVLCRWFISIYKMCFCSIFRV